MTAVTYLRAGLIAVVFGLSVHVPAAAQTTLRFGQVPSTTRNVGTLYLYIAQKKGYFARAKEMAIFYKNGIKQLFANYRLSAALVRKFRKEFSDLNRREIQLVRTLCVCVVFASCLLV